MRRAYYASISFMDSLVGRVVDGLADAGVADHTVIMFVGDHGLHVSNVVICQSLYIKLRVSPCVPLLSQMCYFLFVKSSKKILYLFYKKFHKGETQSYLGLKARIACTEKLVIICLDGRTLCLGQVHQL